MQIKVAVFADAGKRTWRVHAYTLWYSPTWTGCCLHNVEATNGTEAKKVAIAEHRKECLGPFPTVARLREELGKVGK